MPKESPNINSFLLSPPAPTVDSVLSRRAMESKSTLLPPLQSEPMKRCEMGCFMTTFRDNPNTIDHGETARGGTIKRSLEDVWLKGMYSKPAEMYSLDASKVGQINPATGKIWAPHYTPERFERGRVHQAHVELVEVDKSLLSVTTDGFMGPQERRKRHDTLVNCKIGIDALKDAYRTKTKLVRNCQKNYPHGVTNISESPFTQEGQMQEVYAENRTKLVQQHRVANRIGKGHGLNRASVMGSLLRHTENVASDRSPTLV